MSDLLIALKSAYQNAYSVKPYSDVKIYPSIISEKSKFSDSEKKELTKKGFRWYVYFSYLDSSTGKMKRQAPITLNVNREFPKFNDRRKRILIIRDEVQNLLENGYSPYPNNTDLKTYSTNAALNFALSIKKEAVNDTTYSDYKSRCNKFKEYLSNRDLLHSSILEINKNHVNGFLNEILKNSSPRNRNNYLSVLRTVFDTLLENDLITVNHFSTVKNLKSTPIRNRSYSAENLKKLISYLERKDPYLLSFIQLFGYNFLRPVEICRLRCKDIDLNEKILYVRAKNKADKIKKIPDILIEYFQSIDLSKPEYFLFTAENKPGYSSTSEKDRRGYFGKRFAKIKNKLGLGPEYTLYSFRHTFTKKVYNELIKKYTKQETLERLQLITGHESISGLNNYLRSIDAELPEDWSDLL